MNPRKARRAAVLGASAVALLLPATAGAATTVTDADSRLAVASFTQTKGCVSSALSIIVTRDRAATTVDGASQPAVKAKPQVRVEVHRTDTCAGGEPVLVAEGSGQAKRFTLEENLAGAKLEAEIQVSEPLSGKSSKLKVHAEWQPSGPLVKSVSVQDPYEADGCTYSSIVKTKTRESGASAELQGKLDKLVPRHWKQRSAQLLMRTKTQQVDVCP